MSYILDTCVISELTKKNPNKNVIKWIKNTEENKLFISVLTIGEIQKGIEKLSAGNKKEQLANWVNQDLTERFKKRILAFGLQEAIVWGTIQAKSELSGSPMPAIDGQIAATGIANEFIVVTRSISDMEISGVQLLNLWEEQ